MAESLLLQDTAKQRLNSSGNKILTNAGSCLCTPCGEPSDPLTGCTSGGLGPTEWLWPDTRYGSITPNYTTAVYESWSTINGSLTWGVTSNEDNQRASLGTQNMASLGVIHCYTRSSNTEILLQIFSTNYTHSFATSVGDVWDYQIIRLGVGLGTQCKFWRNTSLLEDRTDAIHDMSDAAGCLAKITWTFKDQDPAWFTNLSFDIS